MNVTFKACALMFVVVCSVIFAGCPSSGSTSTYIAMNAQGVINGVTQNIPDVTFVGMAEPGSYSCSGATDQNCLANFDLYEPTGSADFDTDALPATWVIAVEPTTNCTSGGSSGPVALGTNESLTINCGVNDGGLITASPNSCYQVWDTTTNKWITNTCPSGITVTLTASGGTFPTGHAMSVGLYTADGSQLTSNWNVLASSSTSIVVSPTNIVTGDNIITVTDPNTNEVIGAALYTYSYSTKSQR